MLVQYGMVFLVAIAFAYDFWVESDCWCVLFYLHGTQMPKWSDLWVQANDLGHCHFLLMLDLFCYFEID